MKIRFISILITFLFTFCTIAATPRVLLLGDGGSEKSVGQALRDAGADVTVVSDYSDWDGVTPSAADFDVILLLDGLNYGATMQNTAALAISNYVANGGGLVVTEWAAYDAAKGTLNSAVAGLLPVTSTGSYSYGGTWNLTTNHSVLTGLPMSWTDQASYSLVAAKPNAQVLVTNSYASTPMVVVSTNSGGPVVYLNHDLTFTYPKLSPQILQLLVNAVAFVTGNTPQPFAGDILLLDDDKFSLNNLNGSSRTVLTGLRTAGLRVVSAGSYYDWDGVFPDPSRFKAIVFLDGYTYGNGLKAGVSAVLTNYVGNGGGLVVTEWTASDVHDGKLDSTFALLMPVTTPTASFSYGAIWTVIQEANPVVAGLPGYWADPAEYSIVQAVSNATVLVSGPSDLPLVTMRSFGAGKVVHLNNALTYSGEAMSGEAVHLIASAAAFVGGFSLDDSLNADVLVLGDGRSEADAVNALLNAGLKVSFGGRYDGWDGLFPAATNCSAILMLDGYSYGEGLQPLAEKALTNFVNSGGGLVVSEWAAYDVYQGYLDATFGTLLPVVETTYNSGAGALWTVVQPDHPILAGLPAQWHDDVQFSIVAAKPDATVLAQNTNGTPLVTVSDAAGGTVVHLNHALTYSLNSLSSEIQQLIVNAVTFAGHIQSAIQLSLAIPVGVAGDPVRLQFAPASGYDYTVQYRDGLGPMFDWHDLPGAPHNSGQVDDFDHVTQRFYRLKVEKATP